MGISKENIVVKSYQSPSTSIDLLYGKEASANEPTLGIRDPKFAE